MYQGMPGMEAILEPTGPDRGETAFKTGSALPQEIRQYDWIQDHWNHVQTYRQVYNGNGQLVDHLPLDSTGTNLNRFEISYTQEGEESQRVISAWAPGGWQKTSRVTRNYDGNGNLLSMGEQAWSGQWLDMNLLERTYDQFHNETGYHFRRWENERVSYEEEFRFIHTYDTRNRIRETLTLEFENGQWNDKLRIFTTWSSGDLPVVVERKRFALVQGAWKWINEDRYTYQYDLQGRVSLIQYDKADPLRASQWEPFSESVYTYLPNESYSLTYSEFRESAWVPVRRIGNTYDIHGLLVENKLELWNEGKWDTWTLNETLADYDTHGVLLSETRRVWIEALGVFSNVVKFTYGDFLSVTSVDPAGEPAWFEVYPNPATEVIYLSPNTGFLQPAEGVITDQHGRQVSAPFRIRTGSETPVSLEGLAPGQYFIRMWSEGRSQVVRVTKH